MLTSLHQLVSRATHCHYEVSHDGEGFVSSQTFISRIYAQYEYLKTRREKRWLLFNDSPLDFAILFFALLHAEKTVVIPSNILPGTLDQLSDAYDAIATDVILSDSSVTNTGLSGLDAQLQNIELYTSGSTGKPKCVYKNLSQFESEIQVLENLWGDEIEQSTVIGTVPHHHIYGLIFRILWPLSASRTFDAVTCSNFGDITNRIKIFSSVTMVSSPAQLSRLPDVVSISSSVSPPKVIFSSGGPLSALSAKHFHHVFGRAPVEVFGSTETGGIAWRCQCDNDAWTPLTGVEIHSEKSNQPNQALLYSPFLFDEEYVCMDDLIELLPNNTFHLCGRADKIVKVEQKRLSLTAMEQSLCEHAWVNNAAAIIISGRRECVAVAVVLEVEGNQVLLLEGRNKLIEQLRTHLSRYYETILLPRYWRFVEQLPMTESGKVTQAGLYALFDSIDTKSSGDGVGHVTA